MHQYTPQKEVVCWLVKLCNYSAFNFWLQLSYAVTECKTHQEIFLQEKNNFNTSVHLRNLHTYSTNKVNFYVSNVLYNFSVDCVIMMIMMTIINTTTTTTTTRTRTTTTTTTTIIIVLTQLCRILQVAEIRCWTHYQLVIDWHSMTTSQSPDWGRWHWC